MTHSHSPTDDLNPGLWMKKFELELVSSSDKLYGNGRQQSAIRLRVELQSGLTLTEDQKNSLQLVRENLDGSYEILPPPGSQQRLWTQTRIRDENFDLMPGSSTIASLGTQDDADSVFAPVAYVSTTVVGAQTVKLRAMIRRDADTIYYTDESSNFDNYVELTTITPPVFDENDYSWGLSHTQGDTTNRFLHEYKLQLRGVGLAPIVLEMQPGMIRWQYNRPSETYATYVGMAYPGNDRSVHYEDDIETGPNFQPAITAVTDNTASLVLVLNGADNIPYNREGLSYGGPCKVKVIDRHGNEHEIMFAFSDEGSPIERRTIIKTYYS